MRSNSLEVLAEPNTPSLVTRYVLSAPRDLVFEAFTRPELIEKWAAPDGDEHARCRSDLRVGGTWELAHQDASGNAENLHGVYTYIHQPDRLIRTVASDQDPSDEALQTVSFEARGNDTAIITSAVYRTVQARDAHVVDGAQQELRAEYARLEQLLDVLKNSGD
jgi:uncharacterized protein YndB with AHSA1/START domain